MKLFTLMLALLLLSQAAAAAPESSPYQRFRNKSYSTQEVYLARIAEHQAKVMADTEEKLVQQQWLTVAISIMVFVMVLFGLGLSAFQFYSDFKNKGQSSVSFKLGGSNIELNSTVIGIAILALSFWFFQTYVDKVYNIDLKPMQPIDMTSFGQEE